MGAAKKSIKAKDVASQAISAAKRKRGLTDSGRPLKSRTAVQVIREKLPPRFLKKQETTVKDRDQNYAALRTWAASLDLGNQVVSSILDVTPRTILRWNAEEPELTKQQADRIDVVQDIFRLGCEVLGTESSFNAWLRSKVLLLNGERPIDLLSTESGRRKVDSVLHQLHYGQF